MHRFILMLKKVKTINFSIRAKLILIYLLCVIVPIILFSSIFYTSVMNSTKNEKLILFNQAVERIAVNIESNAVSAIQISNIIYSDETMYDYLNKTYYSQEEYLRDYNLYFKEAGSKLLPYNTNIIVLCIYSDNKTIMSTNYIDKLEGTGYKNNWFNQYMKKSPGALFVNHIDEVKVGYAGSKLVSLVRKLDYVKNIQYNHYLRITFRDDTFSKALKTEDLPGILYLVDQNNLIVARSDIQGATYNNPDYECFSDIHIDKKNILIKKELPVMDGWQVICVLDKDFLKADFKNIQRQIFF